MKGRCISALFTVLAGYTLAIGQSRVPLSLGATAYYGFVYQHTDAIGALTNGHPVGAELYCNQLTTGSKPWHKAYQYPQIGVLAGVLDFQSPRLGRLAYAFIYLDKPFTSRQSGLRLKIGWGPGYAFRRYHHGHNFQNIALSSRFNYGIRGELYWSQKLTRKWQLKSGFTLTHFSNGAFKMPNAGINLPAWSFGCSYLLHPERMVKQDEQTTASFWSPTLSLHVSGAFTLKETSLPGGRKFPGAVLSGYVSRKLNAKSFLNAGLDGTYNTAVRHSIARDTTVKGENKPDFKRVAVTLGHELLISEHLALLTQLGMYVYKPYQPEASFYQRYGLKYYFRRRWFTGIMLKAHFGTADFVEWTTGIRIW